MIRLHCQSQSQVAGGPFVWKLGSEFRNRRYNERTGYASVIYLKTYFREGEVQTKEKLGRKAYNKNHSGRPKNKVSQKKSGFRQLING